MSDPKEEAINNFCEYLKIPSVHPNINYDDCVHFLEKQAQRLGVPIKVHYIVPKKPVVVLTWEGSEPSLPSILLNSHMDVVPVYEDMWIHKPFSAYIDAKKNIYARGAQDMKCVGIQYIEAVLRLKREGITLKRTIHMSFVPDEEIGGTHGMKVFVQSKAFKELNVGVALDEGTPTPSEEFHLFYGERCVWQVHIHCPGDPGHGSLLLDNTAGEKVAIILNKFYEFRSEQVKLMKSNPTWTNSDVITINLTKITGGVQTNVIPPEFILSFDCRIPPRCDFQEWEERIKDWCRKAGSGVWTEFEHNEQPVPSTKLDDSNIHWVAFKEVIDRLGLRVKPIICMGITDARFVRGVGIPALGFSPMNHTRLLLHSHNEHLNVDVFLKGIEIYYHILMGMGNKTEESGGV